MKTNQRMCVSCRTRKQKCELIRITNLDEQAVVDQVKQHFGRAIYVCKSNECIAILKKSNAIKRFLKANADENFYKNIIS